MRVIENERVFLPAKTNSIRHEDVLKLPAAVTSLANVVSWVRQAVSGRTGRYVCVANVHMCMEAHDNPVYRQVVRNAGVVVPDGKPLVWGLRLLGERQACHIRGSDLMMRLCREAEKSGFRIGFYGGTPTSLAGLEKIVERTNPGLEISFSSSPPFRPLTQEEDEEYVRRINASKVDILFVGLGCPKQEKWMAAHQADVSCVMLGVGAAFDFYSGQKKPAPVFMQKAGLEWLFRFACEPRRLWKRYLKHNPRFVWYFFKQLLGYNFETNRFERSQHSKEKNHEK